MKSASAGQYINLESEVFRGGSACKQIQYDVVPAIINQIIINQQC